MKQLNEKRLLVPGRSPESSDYLSKSMEQFYHKTIKYNKTAETRAKPPECSDYLLRSREQ